MKTLAILGMLAASGLASADVLYDNGPAVNRLGKSVLISPVGTFGYGNQTSLGNAVADDFDVGGSGWNITGLDFFGYQTSATSFAFTDVSWRIVSGPDVNSGAVVASGTTAVTDGGLVGYRVPLSAPGDQQRAIYELKADVPDMTLAAGSYWLAWSVSGPATLTGPFVAPVSDHRQGNAMQSLDGGTFALLMNPAGTRTSELPFVIEGSVAAVPEPSTLLSLTAGIGMLGLMRRRRRQQPVGR